MKLTIEEIESRLEEDLSKLRSAEFKSIAAMRERLVPPGYRVHVQLLDKKGRKKRKDASADSWSPESGEIRISFEPEPESQHATAPAIEAPPAADPVSDLLRCLDRSESKPGYDFVALKWFRDTVLPSAGFEWAASESSRQTVLREAIERRLILTSKVPNPKSPQFPATAIRLNRLLPDVREILGVEKAPDFGFDPVEIRGETLSATVLRERR
jgi:hypothetical protein